MVLLQYDISLGKSKAFVSIRYAFKEKRFRCSMICLGTKKYF